MNSVLYENSKLVKKLLESEHPKTESISFRLDEKLYKELEAQTEIWNTKTISNTVRVILNMYFLPALYQEELKKEIFPFELVEYLEFLEDVREKNKLLLEQLESSIESLDNMYQKMREELIEET